MIFNFILKLHGCAFPLFSRAYVNKRLARLKARVVSQCQLEQQRYVLTCPRGSGLSIPPWRPTDFYLWLEVIHVLIPERFEDKRAYEHHNEGRSLACFKQHCEPVGGGILTSVHTVRALRFQFSGILLMTHDAFSLLESRLWVAG